MSRLSSKARRMLGLDKKNGNHPHHQIATNAFKADFSLLNDDYYQFWHDCKDPKASAALVSALLEHVMAVEGKGLDKINKTLLQANLNDRYHHQDTVDLFTSNICKTLYFIGLFYPIDQTCPHFKSVVLKWTEHTKLDIGRQVDRTLRMEILLLGARATPLAIDLSWFSAAESQTSSSHLRSSAESERSISGGSNNNARDRKSSTYTSSESKDWEKMDTTLSSFDEFPFATLYARRLLHTGGAQQLFEAALKLMTNLPQRLKMGTATTVRSMSALMLILTQLRLLILLMPILI